MRVVNLVRQGQARLNLDMGPFCIKRGSGSIDLRNGHQGGALVQRQRLEYCQDICIACEAVLILALILNKVGESKHTSPTGASG